MDPRNISKGFTSARNSKITYGRGEVAVPRGHRIGETGTSTWTKLRRWDFRDDRLALLELHEHTKDTFWLDLQQRLIELQREGEVRHLVVFIHGYNNSFESAAIRAAQIGFDLKVHAMAFFSWPSVNKVKGYLADAASIEASETAITEFLAETVERSGAEKVHLIAHSMGNRGLLRSLQRIGAAAESKGSVKFGQIFLAAPDVDRDLFLQLSHVCGAGERTTLYASAGDRAVYLSSKVHAAPRAGYFLPYTVAAGVDTIAVPNFDVDVLGHGYFAQAEALLHDFYELLRHGTPPEKRQRLEQFAHGEDRLWRVLQ